jgi:hypothetical protein
MAPVAASSGLMIAEVAPPKVAPPATRVARLFLEKPPVRMACASGAVAGIALKGAAIAMPTGPVPKISPPSSPVPVRTGNSFYSSAEHQKQ